MKKVLTKNKEHGFTLIEIMTAVSIFAIVATISMGSILTVFDVNRKSESIKSVMDNLNLAIESMAREIRFGTYYSCNPTLPTLLPPSKQNCSSGAESMAFLSNDQTQSIVYRKFGTTIEKSKDAGSTFVPVTAPEIVINDLKFFVLGALPSSSESGNPQQPKVLMKIKGTAGTKDGTKSEFTVQTLVSQRQLDR